ncbi:MAG: ATP-dependent helicase [Phytoplasma sp.]|uniref:ATP-dependent helicase n=1 Tax=Phytoplasma sp. TaxID=2155 RepID=UPI002B40F813|nr:ATP-dependent helicase [Phytoplasma sp.]WRH06656.1 MAG: ATP-dependent helicase [Phytoplasma sp.]
METRKWLNNLNEEQIKAIISNEKKIYLQAGAGTGKTTTLTNKIIHYINEFNIKGENILAITFTNNAAKEMKERLKQMIPSQTFPYLTISTFHAFGYSFLKKNIHKFNLKFNSLFVIIDEREANKIIREQINVLNLDKNKYNAQKLQKKILQMKNDKIKKQILSEINLGNIYCHTNKNLKLFFSEEENRIFDFYNKYLEKNNLLDFDDLIIYTYQLLKNNSSLAYFYQKKFSHILIDEFQDIDLIQYQIIKLIGEDNFIFAVGDSNQNIYSFRGSDSSCNDLFLQDFSVQKLALTRNYRSTKNILDKANLLIKNNYNKDDNRFQINLKSNNFFGEKVVYKRFSDASKEAKFISNKIRDLVNNQNYSYKDIAILFRLNALSKEIENSLFIHNIPYFIRGSITLFQRKEIKDFVAYLKVLLFNKNDFYFKRIINVPRRQIGYKTIMKLEQIAIQKQMSLFEAMDHISDDDNIKIKINNLKKIFNKLSDVFYDEQKCNLSNVLSLIDENIKYSEILDKDKDRFAKNDNEKIKKNLSELKKIFIAEDQKQTNNTFLEKLSLLLNKITLSNEKESDDEIPQVLLSSIHKVKGLEFKIVFSVGWDANIFKDGKHDNDSDLFKEERRIAYVAITRAKELLYLTSAKIRFFLREKELSEPVSFLKEMKLITDNSFVFNDNILSKFKQDKNISNNKVTNQVLYRIGDKIMHEIFGKGTILSINKEILTIVFAKPHGIKKILMHHRSWKKI